MEEILEVIVAILVIIAAAGSKSKKKKKAAAKAVKFPEPAADAVPHAEPAAPAAVPAQPAKPLTPVRIPSVDPRAIVEAMIDDLPEPARKALLEVEKSEKTARKKTKSAPKSSKKTLAQPVSGQSRVDAHGCIGGSLTDHEPEGESEEEHSEHMMKVVRLENAASRSSLGINARKTARAEMRRAVVWAEILDKPVSLRG